MAKNFGICHYIKTNWKLKILCPSRTCEENCQREALCSFRQHYLPVAQTQEGFWNEKFYRKLFYIVLDNISSLSSKLIKMYVSLAMLQINLSLILELNPINTISLQVQFVPCAYPNLIPRIYPKILNTEVFFGVMHSPFVSLMQKSHMLIVVFRPYSTKTFN